MPPTRIIVLVFSVTLASAIGVRPVAAQTEPAPVLTGKAVTESNLLQALTPPPDGGDVDVSGTRSLVIGAANGSTQAVAAPRRKPGASLLITFETNSSALTLRSRQQLAVVGAALRNERLKDYSFDIEGHADPRGDHAANLALSQQRAESVRGFLVHDESIPAAKLRAIGKGDSEPLNTADIAAEENRRVTIVTNAPQ